jgi:hippurate hydrolase
MHVSEQIMALGDTMTGWRHRIHRRPELAFKEHETSDFIAEKLAEFGVTVHRGLAGTGVVGTLTNGEGDAVGLRADMDALPIQEATGLPYQSEVPGVMHACGHDGHTAMLLGAAKYLAETRRFSGRVHFIFQPAEENEAGGRAMVEDGLFERFPVKAVFGLHNWPGLPVGRAAVRAGPMMAACDLFDIVLTGRQAHAAMPHQGVDPVVTGATLISALQSIVSRSVDPQQAAVISVTRLNAGDAYNIVPETARLAGTVRTFDPAVQDLIEARIRRVVSGVASAHGCTADVQYDRRYPATINNADEAGFAASVAADVLGEAHVDRAPAPSMGSEDFAFMLQAVPGAYIWLGAGTGDAPCGLHHPQYDFEDSVLPLGAAYWVRVAEKALG